MKIAFREIRAPWLSADAEYPTEYKRDFAPYEPQEQIDRCLGCEYASGACEYCDGTGNLREARQYAKYDPDVLRELLRMKVCHREIAKRMGVSRATYFRYVKKLRSEEPAIV